MVFGKKGCSQRKALGSKNNIPFWVFMSAVMSRAVYQYDGLFQHLIKSYFNNKFILQQFNKLKDTNKLNLYKPLLSEKLAGGSKRLNKLNNRLLDTTTFTKNSAQYLATLINTTNDIAADFDYGKILVPDKKNKLFDLAAHNSVFGGLYARDDYLEKQVKKSDDLSFVYIQTDIDFNCYVVYHKPSKTLMVTFRGTSSIKSSIEDIKAITSDVVTPTNIDESNKKSYGNMHKGFLGQQIGSFHRIVYAMKMVIDNAHPNTKPSKDKLKLFVFGHSLGGANTTVFSYFYQYWKVQMSKVLQAPYLNVPLYVVSWGQPRVGTKIFARDYYKLMDPRIQSGGETNPLALNKFEMPNGKIHFIRAKTDGDLVPEVPKTVNVFKSENAYFHVGEDVNIKNQKPFQCNSRIDKVSQQLHYMKPLQCDHRFSCSAAKGMFAHTNAAYISFLTILKTASIGSQIPSGHLEFVYNRLDPYEIHKGRIKGYRKNFLMSLDGYNKEMLSNRSVVEVMPHPGTQEDGRTRIANNLQLGTFMKGYQPSMFRKTKKRLGGKKRRKSKKRKKTHRRYKKRGRKKRTRKRKR